MRGANAKKKKKIQICWNALYRKGVVEVVRNSNCHASHVQQKKIKLLHYLISDALDDVHVLLLLNSFETPTCFVFEAH